MNNATSFWGTNAGCAAATAGTGTQTCNGNGNGLVESADPGGVQETWYIWQHLANAGLIVGSYSGVGPNYYGCSAARCPMGKASGTSWGVLTWGVMPGNDGWWWNDGTRILFVYGSNNNGSGYTGYATLSPEEAWNVDTKVDDGKPGLGKWMSFAGSAYNPSCAVVAATGAALAVTDFTKANAPNIGYNLSDKTARCGFQIWW